MVSQDRWSYAWAACERLADRYRVMAIDTAELTDEQNLGIPVLRIAPHRCGANAKTANPQRRRPAPAQALRSQSEHPRSLPTLHEGIRGAGLGW